MSRTWRLPARLWLSLGCVVGGSWSWSQQPPPPSENPKPGERVVLSIGEEKLTAADVERIIQALPPQYRAFYASQGRHVLPQYLVRMKILTAEAQKQNLEKQPEVQQAIEIATESILADAAQKRMQQSISVPQDALLELYQQRKSEFEEARIRRILIRTENSILGESINPSRPPLSSAEARKKLEDLRRQITDGADFGELAKTHSDDLATASTGGDMGYVDRQKVVPPIAQAAFTLAPGQVSDIIPTPYGLELIKVEERRVKPLADVQPLLEAQYRQGKIEGLIQQLQSQYKIEVDNEFFAPDTKPQTSETRIPTNR